MLYLQTSAKQNLAIARKCTLVQEEIDLDVIYESQLIKLFSTNDVS